jgi:hypothetical protein
MAEVREINFAATIARAKAATRCLSRQSSWWLQQLDLVAHPNRAVLDHPRADTTATL